MAVPKRKTSKMKARTRKAANRWKPRALTICSQCGSKVPAHIACPSCGYYSGRQVLTIEVV